jgi:hypothetical protein
MKTQQRKFIVERKGGRRRLTIQPASIWGDTDLKAIVRKAEADAPHLFAHDTVSGTPDQVSEPQQEPTPETHLNDETDTGDQPILAVPIEADQRTPSQQGDHPTSNAAAQLKLDTAGPRSPRMARRRRAAAGSRHAEGANIAPTSGSTAVEVEAPADELVALEAENRRLKGLLAQHFREQNTRLRKMLARFSVS